MKGVEGIGFKPAIHVDPTVTSPGLAIFTPSPIKSSNKKENSTTFVENTSAAPAHTTGESILKPKEPTSINPLAKPIINKYTEEEQSTTAWPRAPPLPSTSNLNQISAGEETEVSYKVQITGEKKKSRSV